MTEVPRSNPGKPDRSRRTDIPYDEPMTRDTHRDILAACTRLTLGPRGRKVSVVSSGAYDLMTTGERIDPLLLDSRTAYFPRSMPSEHLMTSIEVNTHGESAGASDLQKGGARDIARINMYIGPQEEYEDAPEIGQVRVTLRVTDTHQVSYTFDEYTHDSDGQVPIKLDTYSH